MMAVLLIISFADVVEAILFPAASFVAVSAEDLTHTTDDTVRSITACSPVSGWVKSLWLSFFGLSFFYDI